MKYLVAFIILAISFGIYLLTIITKEANRVSEQNQKEWQEYKARCVELGGLPSKQFDGFNCEK